VTTAAEALSIQTLPGQRRRAARVLLLWKDVFEDVGTRGREYTSAAPTRHSALSTGPPPIVCLTITMQHIHASLTHLSRSPRGLRTAIEAALEVVRLGG
jgi:hypothetical protein